MSERLAIFAEGLFAKHTGKTAHGVIRYGNRDVVAVIDSTCAGRTANEVEPFALHPVPIVATLDEAIELRRERAADRRGADRAASSIPPGGRRCWRRSRLGCSLEAGPAHPAVATTPSCASRQPSGRRRAARPARRALGPDGAEGPVQPRPDSVRVVHSVGSDTVIGKKVVTLELDRAARERGLRSVYVPTGQTGVAIAGWGIAVDHVISDYVAGAGERLVHEGAERGRPAVRGGPGRALPPGLLGSHAGAAARLGAGPARAGEQAERHAQPQLPGPADPVAERADPGVRGRGARRFARRRWRRSR